MDKMDWAGDFFDDFGDIILIENALKSTLAIAFT